MIMLNILIGPLIGLWREKCAIHWLWVLFKMIMLVQDDLRIACSICWMRLSKQFSSNYYFRAKRLIIRRCWCHTQTHTQTHTNIRASGRTLHGTKFNWLADRSSSCLFFIATTNYFASFNQLLITRQTNSMFIHLGVTRAFNWHWIIEKCI